MLTLLITRLLMSLILLTGSASTPVASPELGDLVLVGAGDISTCNVEGDARTAKLLDEIDGTIFTLGDNAYPDGTPNQFAECYDPTWGLHKERTRPAPGNHDYHTPGATGYFDYFGEAAGDPDKRYYSYDLGAWHIIVLNSNCDEIGGCDEGSPQVEWLEQGLVENGAECTLAYWHHPVFSSGQHGNQDEMEEIWPMLADTGTDVVLAGHDHTYERFAPMNADGELDEAGIRSFVVGTGGASTYDFEEIADNSEVRDNESHGVLKLTLHDDSYDWEFIAVDGDTFTDAGTGECH